MRLKRMLREREAAAAQAQAATEHSQLDAKKRKLAPRIGRPEGSLIFRMWRYALCFE